MNYYHYYNYETLLKESSDITFLMFPICQLTLYFSKPCFSIPFNYSTNFLTYTPLLSFKLFFFFFNLFILVLAALGLHCCTRAFSSCGELGLLFIAMRALLIVVASLVAKHRLQARGLQQVQRMGSVVVAQGLSCSTARGIFPDQGSNLCPLHWQADS